MGAFDSIGDLSDVKVRGPLLPANTKVSLRVRKAEANTDNGKNYLWIEYEVSRGEHSGYDFGIALGLDGKVNEGKKMSQLDMTKIHLKGLVGACVADTAAVNTFFRGCTSGADLAQRVSSQLGDIEFAAELGVDAERTVGDKTYGERQKIKNFVPAK